MREDIKDLVKEALELNSRLKKDKARLSELKNTILSESEGRNHQRECRLRVGCLAAPFLF